MASVTKYGKAVIGANYGDEGKGVITDYLAQDASVVIRFNSSAQAGHTVQTPEGKRHVFHHVGSGTFAGAATYLSKHFISHPMLFGEEIEDLGGFDQTPAIFADGRGLVAVPHDIMINQWIESKRGDGRHGSCGVGFNECIERSFYPEYKITVWDLLNKFSLRRKLIKIVNEWVPERMRQLELNYIDNAVTPTDSFSLIDRWMWDVEEYLHYVTICDKIPNVYKNVVFEGAQGLALDQNTSGFPYLTRSNTGLRNVVQIALEFDIIVEEAIYVTRCYTTRHGAGPLPYEWDEHCGIKVDDLTNFNNEFQGSLRFAPIDIDHMGARIVGDGIGATIKKSVAITCMDQVVGKIPVVIGRNIFESSPERFIDDIKKTHKVRFTTWGPTRDDVMEEKDAKI